MDKTKDLLVVLVQEFKGPGGQLGMRWYARGPLSYVPFGSPFRMLWILQVQLSLGRRALHIIIIIMYVDAACAVRGGVWTLVALLT